MKDAAKKKSWARRVASAPFLLAILFYRRFISPLMPPSCRFYPSCSAYGLESFQTHPPLRALRLTVWRILRCNPFNDGGYDPVPPSAAEIRRASETVRRSS